MKALAGRDITVGGPDLRLNLELIDERRFQSGVVHLHYRVRT